MTDQLSTRRRTRAKEAREYQNYVADGDAGRKAFREGVSRDACPYPKSWVKRCRRWRDSWDLAQEVSKCPKPTA